MQMCIYQPSWQNNEFYKMKKALICFNSIEMSLPDTWEDIVLRNAANFGINPAPSKYRAISVNTSYDANTLNF